MLCQQAFRRVSMANPALELKHFPIAHLEHYTPTGRAGGKRRALGRLTFLHFLKILFHPIRSARLSVGLAAGPWAGVILDEIHQSRPDLIERQAVIWFDIGQGAARHVRMRRIIRVLYNREPTTPLYRQQPGSAIVEKTGQDNTDDATAMRLGRAT